MNCTAGVGGLHWLSQDEDIDGERVPTHAEAQEAEDHHTPTSPARAIMRVKGLDLRI
jgi:hypothetical protein